MAGVGPEYDFPETAKDEPIPVVGNEDVAGDENTSKVVGEEAGDLSDKAIADEEKLETEQAGEWSEDMAAEPSTHKEDMEELIIPPPKDRSKA